MATPVTFKEGRFSEFLNKEHMAMVAVNYLTTLFKAHDLPRYIEEGYKDSEWEVWSLDTENHWFLHFNRNDPNCVWVACNNSPEQEQLFAKWLASRNSAYLGVIDDA